MTEAEKLRAIYEREKEEALRKADDDAVLKICNPHKAFREWTLAEWQALRDASAEAYAWMLKHTDKTIDEYNEQAERKVIYSGK